MGAPLSCIMCSRCHFICTCQQFDCWANCSTI